MPNTKGWHQWLFHEHPSASSTQTIFGTRADSLLICRLIASDDEFSLFSVVAFRRVHDEFVQKCREQKWVAFTSFLRSWPIRVPGLSSANLFIMKKRSLKNTKIWRWLERQRRNYGCGKFRISFSTNWYPNQTELLRLSRTNFSESFQILVHLKVIRLFVESVLRYGLPAEYIGVVIKVQRSSPSYRRPHFTPPIYLFQPDPKNVKKLFNVLQTQFASLRPRSSAADGKKLGAEDFIGEYQTLMDQEFFDFVLYEVPWIIT